MAAPYTQQQLEQIIQGMSLTKFYSANQIARYLDFDVREVEGRLEYMLERGMVEKHNTRMTYKMYPRDQWRANQQRREERRQRLFHMNEQERARALAPERPRVVAPAPRPAPPARPVAPVAPIVPVAPAPAAAVPDDWEDGPEAASIVSSESEDKFDPEDPASDPVEVDNYHGREFGEDPYKWCHLYRQVVAKQANHQYKFALATRPPRSNKTLIYFPKSLTMAQWKLVNEEQDSYFIVPATVVDKIPNHHHYLAANRVVSEAIAYDLAEAHHGGNIIDVDGNPRRHEYYRRDIFTMCTGSQPGDTARAIGYADIPPEEWCRHLLESCPHVEVLDVQNAIFVHKDYYYTPQRLYDFLTRLKLHTAYVVRHDFLDLRGDFPFMDATYDRTGPDEITMWARGNLTPYMIPAGDWWRSSPWQPPMSYWQSFIHDRVPTLSWTVVRTIGMTTVYKLMATLEPYATPMTVPVSLRERLELLQTNPVLSPLSGLHTAVTGDVPLYTPGWRADVNTLGIFPGGMLFWFGTRKRVLIPRGVVEEVATTVVLEDRVNGEGLMDVSFTNKVRKRATLVLNKTTLTSVEKADALPIITALSLTYSAESELGVLTNILGPAMGLFRRVYAAKRSPQRDWTIFWIAGGVVVLVSGYFFTNLAKHGFRSAATRLMVKTWRPLGVVTPVVAVSCLLADLLMTWKRRAARGAKPETVVGRVVYTDVCTAGVPTKEPAGKTLATFRTPLDSGDRCLPHYGTEALGWFSRLYRPVVPRRCVHNEVNATRSRQVPVNETPEELRALSWSVVRLAQQANWQAYFPDARRVEALSYTAWANRRVVNQGARIKFREARDELAETGQMPELFNRGKVFVKREHLLKANGEVSDFVPRLITSRQPEFLITLGPWLVAFGNELKRMWSPSNWVVYTSGLNANRMGNAFDAFMTEHPFVYVSEQDKERFDGTMSREALQHELMVYERFGMPRKQLACIRAQWVTKNTSNNGFRFTGSDARKSGDPNTSCGNSFEDASTTMVVVERMRTCHCGAPNRPALSWEDAIAGAKNILALSMPRHEAGEAIDAYIAEDGEALLQLRTLIDSTPPDCDCFMKLVKLFVMGDDTLGMAATAELHELLSNTWFPRACGFRPTPVLCDRWTATFCSARMWPARFGDYDTVLMGPFIGRVLAKTGHAKDPVPASSWENPTHAATSKGLLARQAWARGVALGLEKDVAHIPVLRALVEVVLRLTIGVEAKPIFNEWAIHARTGATVNGDTWEMMDVLYGLSETQVVGLEQYLSRATSLPICIDHPVVHRIMEVDIGEADAWGGSNILVENTGPSHSIYPGALWDFYTVLGAPVIEEYLKHKYKPYFMIWLLFQEVIIQGTHPLTVLMHFVAYRMPVKSAMVLHGVFNLWATSGKYYLEHIHEHVPYLREAGGEDCANYYINAKTMYCFVDSVFMPPVRVANKFVDKLANAYQYESIDDTNLRRMSLALHAARQVVSTLDPGTPVSFVRQWQSDHPVVWSEVVTAGVIVPDTVGTIVGITLVATSIVAGWAVSAFLPEHYGAAYTIGVTPVVEELAKRILGPVYTCALICLEAASHRWNKAYWPTAIMHVGCHTMPLPIAIGVHSAWNMAALVQYRPP